MKKKEKTVVMEDSMNANQLRTIERVCSTTNLQDIKCEVQVNIHKKREREKSRHG